MAENLALKKKIDSLIEEVNKQLIFLLSEKNKNEEVIVVTRNWLQSIMDIKKICVERNKF